MAMSRLALLAVRKRFASGLLLCVLVMTVSAADESSPSTSPVPEAENDPTELARPPAITDEHKQQMGPNVPVGTAGSEDDPVIKAPNTEKYAESEFEISRKIYNNQLNGEKESIPETPEVDPDVKDIIELDKSKNLRKTEEAIFDDIVSLKTRLTQVMSTREQERMAATQKFDEINKGEKGSQELARTNLQTLVENWEKTCTDLEASLKHNQDQFEKQTDVLKTMEDEIAAISEASQYFTFNIQIQRTDSNQDVVKWGRAGLTRHPSAKSLTAEGMMSLPNEGSFELELKMTPLTSLGSSETGKWQYEFTIGGKTEKITDLTMGLLQQKEIKLKVSGVLKAPWSLKMDCTAAPCPALTGGVAQQMDAEQDSVFEGYKSKLSEAKEALENVISSCIAPETSSEAVEALWDQLPLSQEHNTLKAKLGEIDGSLAALDALMDTKSLDTESKEHAKEIGVILAELKEKLAEELSTKIAEFKADVITEKKTELDNMDIKSLENYYEANIVNTDVEWCMEKDAECTRSLREDAATNENLKNHIKEWCAIHKLSASASPCNLA